LLEDPEKSYHAPHRVTENDLFDNRLIFGDNLLALKALEAEFAGQVKCVFIDPPYNTGSAFTHYDDGLEHSIWLSMMRDRLELIRKLLSDDGSLWITIDDNEAHYLKLLCDEVFGRGNFISTIIWQKKYAPKSDSKYFSNSHDFILVFAKDLNQFQLGRLSKSEKQTGRYTNRDNDPRGPWKASDVLRNEARDYAVFPVILPSGREVWPPSGTSWRYTKEKFAELIVDNRIWFGVNGDARPAYKRFLSEVTDGDDKGGITEAVNWQGGGGFRYYKLAPSLLKQDKWGNWVINPDYHAEMLAAALCKLEGFTYAPSETLYWQQGYSTERDFIYVTTQNLSHDQLAHLADEVGTDRTLLVLCMAFRGKPNFQNLTIKKIPKHVLTRCEWDHDDYSLKVENLPQSPPKLGQIELEL